MMNTYSTNYFITLEKHEKEIEELNEELKANKKLLKYYKDENKRLEKENEDMKGKIEHFLNYLGRAL